MGRDTYWTHKNTPPDKFDVRHELCAPIGKSVLLEVKPDLEDRAGPQPHTPPKCQVTGGDAGNAAELKAAHSFSVFCAKTFKGKGQERYVTHEEPCPRTMEHTDTSWLVEKSDRKINAEFVDWRAQKYAVGQSRSKGVEAHMPRDHAYDPNGPKALEKNHVPAYHGRYQACRTDAHCVRDPVATDRKGFLPGMPMRPPRQFTGNKMDVYTATRDQGHVENE